MNATKIQLSEDELSLVENGQLLLTKNAIIDKAVDMMGALHGVIAGIIQELRPPLPEEVLKSSPRVSKGEKYEGLPWVMLDYPKVFSKQDVFALRTMFWWGNFISITLHLSGDYRKRFAESLLKNKNILQENDFHLSISDDEWRHDFASTNYIPLDRLNEQAVQNILSVTDFCKVSVRIPLRMWNLSMSMADTSYRAIFSALIP